MKTFEFTQDQINLLLDCIETTIEENSGVLNMPHIDISTSETLRENIVKLRTLYNYLNS
jgi:hypothetical protein